jgi:isoleucyl-tRNA synthetase
MTDTGARSDYRDTLNLPRTDFAMKAELPKREPGRIAWWERERSYERRLERNAQNGPWVLHDGPPYANNEPHMGGFFNMVLKDVFVKAALLQGKYAAFVPGWDMHGLPIELETLKFLGIKDFHSIDPVELRRQCRERAVYWFERQRDIRIRMGNFGDWKHPYRTIDKSFEATIVRALADLAESNQLYKGLRSTLWCVHDETALAEAEIEYEQKVSPSIDVRFPARGEQMLELERRFGIAHVDAPLSILIWTTTPWTLPANVAVALRADAAYGLYRLDNERLIVATALAESVFGERFADAELLATAAGSQLERATVRHPFEDRDSLLVLADYVELETGTGAVHTAPGHGADDFETGVRYGLDVLNPVDAAGRFTGAAGKYAGLFVFKANDRIIEDLRASGALWSVREYEHSYPHCWRCHNPVIFRATAQWFISMDRNDLRERVVNAIQDVAYVPSWGRNRQTQMIQTHPEWCISRQRTWGTPIPALICRSCGQSILDAGVARRAADRFEEVGADVWWTDDAQTYLPDGFPCPHCGGGNFDLERNIVDIWFESGVTHLEVLKRDGLTWPSDAVLEGADQYRGWFRSSLITGVAIKGGAPYRRVVTHGWVNDEQGRAMSKSSGTGIGAREAMERWGADVLRLWTASVEFVDDARFGPNVVDQIGRVYRNLRNRIRFMLGNVDDLPRESTVARESMQPLDQLACDVADAFAAKVRASYDAFALHDVYLQIVEFESAMSSLYFDALKDPLYSRARNDARRRSAQSALLYVLQRMLAAVAPVLSFTAEEAWQSLPEALRGDARSVFDLDLSGAAGSDVANERWQFLRDLRGRVAASQSPRDFEAKVRAGVSPATCEWLQTLGDNVREALVVSELELFASDREEFEILPASGEKCARCWKYRALGNDPENPLVCTECAQVLAGLPDPE